MRGLEDKRVLVTGGAGGIGAATAVRFLEEGSRVVVLDRDEAALAKIVKDLPRLSGTIVADVSDVEAVAQAFEELDELDRRLRRQKKITAKDFELRVGTFKSVPIGYNRRRRENMKISKERRIHRR